MHRSELFLAGLLAVTAPIFFGVDGAVRDTAVEDDPFTDVVLALDQGRHWYAARLLRDLNDGERSSPRAHLLAARADAGRGAWRSVARQLESAVWLDSISRGEGRALLARARLETGSYESAVDDFRAYLRYSTDRAQRAFAEVGLARAMYALGETGGAAESYSRAADLSPALGPWLSLRAAESVALLGDTAAVRRFLSRSAERVHRRLEAQVSAHENADDWEGAVGLLLKAAEHSSTKSRSAELRARAASILLQQGDTVRARRTLHRALRVQPSRAREAAEILAELPGLTAEEHQTLGHAFERSGVPLEAATHYREYLSIQPLSKLEGQRLKLKIGDLLFRGGSYFIALDELEHLIATKPPASLIAQAEYLAARVTYRRGWRREGRARLRELSDRYPGTASALRALSLLGDLYESAGKAEEARAIYQEITERYAGSRTAPRVRYRLGILAFLEGDYATARHHFDRLRSSSRWNAMKISATYWAARARAAGEPPQNAAEAQRLFRIVHSRDPYGYYGFLAAERAGIDPWSELAPGPEPAPVGADIEEKLELIDLLRRTGLDEEAQTVLADILGSRSRKPEEILGLSIALAEHGFGREAVTVGWRAHSRLRGVWSASVLRAVYPFAFQEIILAESDARELDPYLVAAIARQESAFAADVVSRAGARGLLQLMPETGKWWARRLGIRDYDPGLLFHPETNVHLGTAYYADLERRYGELQLSLVAYNAGPTRARRWRERPEYRIDAELFAERIPFSETRNYVRSVQAHYRIYSHLYGGRANGKPVD
jgi:soluble lytic murein transglycosylase